jgi:hypothetical protein
MELVELLMKEAADLRMENSQGKTALQLASEVGSEECARRMKRGLEDSLKLEEERKTSRMHSKSTHSLLA